MCWFLSWKHALCTVLFDHPDDIPVNFDLPFGLYYVPLSYNFSAISLHSHVCKDKGQELLVLKPYRMY